MRNGNGHSLRAISLFSGAGGLDLGVERAGFTVVFANDAEPRCAESFSLNRPKAGFFLGSAVDITRHVLADVSGGRAEEGVDLLVGGPPCPPFSKSRFYLKNKPRALDDPSGLATVQAYLNVLRIARPRAFLLENVAGFAYKVHEHAVALVEQAATRAGYTCAWQVLDAADYGVPQSRSRFFMVGLRGRKFEFPRPTHAQPSERDLIAEGLPPRRTAGEAIGDLDTPENADDAGHFAGGQHHDLLRKVPPGDNYLFFTRERGHRRPVFKWRSRYWSFLLKLSPDLPSWTIQARRSNNMGPFHWRNRILRIAEVKRLQTFPDGWRLAGTVEAQWRQVGNAVPPRLAEAIGRAIREQLA